MFACPTWTGLTPLPPFADPCSPPPCRCPHAQVFDDVVATDNDAQKRVWHRHWVSLKAYWPRLMVASMAWIANDFAFYGNKLFQSTFINLLYPGATQYVQQKWTVLNSFVALTGYYM